MKQGCIAISETPTATPTLIPRASLRGVGAGLPAEDCGWLNGDALSGKEGKLQLLPLRPLNFSAIAQNSGSSPKAKSRVQV